MPACLQEDVKGLLQKHMQVGTQYHSMQAGVAEFANAAAAHSVKAPCDCARQGDAVPATNLLCGCCLCAGWVASGDAPQGPDQPPHPQAGLLQVGAVAGLGLLQLRKAAQRLPPSTHQAAACYPALLPPIPPTSSSIGHSHDSKAAYT
jgi:hypothetical protein